MTPQLELNEIPSLSPSQFKRFQKLFHKGYMQFYHRTPIDPALLQEITSQYLTAKDFQKLTLCRQLQRYITLINGIIRFEEIPNSPHGEITGHLKYTISSQIEGTCLTGCGSNGTPFTNMKIINIDVILFHNSVKRPDSSFALRRNRLPTPIPEWIRFQDGCPYPNIVIEVVLDGESKTSLIDKAHRYFSEITSITTWIGVKVNVQEQSLWLGWGERNDSGVGAIIHDDMLNPVPLGTPCELALGTPCELVYRIPMEKVLGPGIPMEGCPTTLNINVESIRLSSQW
jgi:hypothetical protein